MLSPSTHGGSVPETFFFFVCAKDLSFTFLTWLPEWRDTSHARADRYWKMVYIPPLKTNGKE